MNLSLTPRKPATAGPLKMSASAVQAAAKNKRRRSDGGDQPAALQRGHNTGSNTPHAQQLAAAVSGSKRARTTQGGSRAVAGSTNQPFSLFASSDAAAQAFSQGTRSTKKAPKGKAKSKAAVRQGKQRQNQHQRSEGKGKPKKRH